jgi:phage terminase small subunit
MELSAEALELGYKLTRLQRQTVINIVSKQMSNREAYRAAGGKSERNAAIDSAVCAMLSVPKVKAFYEALMNAAATSAVMTREEALQRLTRASRVVITDIAEFKEDTIGQDENGDAIMQTSWRIKNSQELTPDAAASIKSLTVLPTGAKLDLHDPLAAIKQIADMQGWKIAPPPVVINNNTITASRVMIVKDHGTDEEWEKKLRANQQGFKSGPKH